MQPLIDFTRRIILSAAAFLVMLTPAYLWLIVKAIMPEAGPRWVIGLIILLSQLFLFFRWLWFTRRVWEDFDKEYRPKPKEGEEEGSQKKFHEVPAPPRPSHFEDPPSRQGPESTCSCPPR